MSRRLPEKNAMNTRAEVRRPADGESLDVEGGFLEPGGVISDEDERSEADLVLQPHRKSLRRLPHSGRQLSWE